LDKHCTITALLGCAFTEEGYIKVDSLQETTVKGIYAYGDNTTRMRTLNNTVGMGTTAGMTVSKKMIWEEF
jgi:thioredoxin reductase